MAVGHRALTARALPSKWEWDLGARAHYGKKPASNRTGADPSAREESICPRVAVTERTLHPQNSQQPLRVQAELPAQAQPGPCPAHTPQWEGRWAMRSAWDAQGQALLSWGAGRSCFPGLSWLCALASGCSCNLWGSGSVSGWETR